MFFNISSLSFKVFMISLKASNFSSKFEILLESSELVSEACGTGILSAVAFTKDSKDEYLVLRSSTEVFKSVSIEVSILFSIVFLDGKFLEISVGIFVTILSVFSGAVLTLLDTVSMVI